MCLVGFLARKYDYLISAVEGVRTRTGEKSLRSLDDSHRSGGVLMVMIHSTTRTCETCIGEEKRWVIPLRTQTCPEEGKELKSESKKEEYNAV